MTTIEAQASAEGVLDYLRQKFDRADGHPTETGSFLIVVQDEGQNWRVNVSEEFLQSHSGEMAAQAVEEWNLAGEMRRAEGMGFAVGSSGVQLESSN